MHQHPNTAFPESHPCYHTANIKAMLSEIIVHLDEDRHKFEEPRAQALFETGTEVLLGLYSAFDRYEKSDNESAREPDARDLNQ